MAEPILNRLELRRLPFQRRPVAEPGTTLVFRMPDGRLVAPVHPYTTGETWWKGPKTAYVVDVKAHPASFVCELSSSAGAVYFSATVSYSWAVYDAARVVQERVENPEAECRGYLERWMPTITGRFPPLDTAGAEDGLHRELGRRPIDLERGIRIRDLHVRLRMDADQFVLAKEKEIGNLRQEIAERDAEGQKKIEWIHQRHDLGMENERQESYSATIARGREAVMALVVAQSPDRAPEILNAMISLSEREEQRTLEAIKVLIDGGEIRLGELDGAVSAAVERISAILGKGRGSLDGSPDSSDIRALPSSDADAGNEES